jgi:regulator of protease activity HflC (stomatin/prohibitin superfamily)
MEENMTDLALVFIVSAVVIGVLFVLSGIRVLPAHECGIVFRSGLKVRAVHAGWNWIIPGIEQLRKVDLRPMNILLEQENIITRDSIGLKIDALFWYRIVDPERAILSVADYRKMLRTIALTSLRIVVGHEVMDEALKRRDSLSREMQKLIDDRAEPFGIQIEAVEIKNMEIPVVLQRALERKAEAERKLAEFRQGTRNS